MKKVGFFRSIQLKFIIIYILLLLIAVQVIGSYVARELETELLDNYKETINDRIDLLSYNLELTFEKDRSENNDEPTLQEEVQAIINDVNLGGQNTLQVINNQGRILGTNDYNQDIVGKKITDEIIQKGIKSGTSVDSTYIKSKTGDRILVRVEPILDKDRQITGVVYLETSLESVYTQLSKINDIFLKGSIIALIISVLIGILVARAITKPIIEMRRQAQKMARGDFSQKVNVYGSDEISQLAVTFNHLNDRLKHSMATIEKERSKLSSVLANMSEGVIATDNEGQITLINEAAGKLLGKNPNYLINQSLIEHLELEEKVLGMSELQEGGSIILNFSTEEIYLVRANFSTIYDDYDKVSGFITVLSDVTEEEKIERERREFVSNVSHELRTPLTTLRSYLEALTDGAWKDEEIAPHFLEVTQNETERMIRMVSSLLELSRMDSKADTLHRRRVDFTSFFHEIIDRFDMNLKDAEIVLNRDIPNETTYVWIDKDKMTQVLDNIISNAVKYSPDGGKINFKLEKSRRQIIVSIEDNGIGIAYDKLDKIFDRFYRADKARTREMGGTGLGLAITQEIVEAHYGKIWVDSKEGKGTTIYFSLPLMNEMRRRQI
ncbi:MAG TPA: cell wall metabolism sensor histidine kinase WalK [Pseudogracilibacillus sp.]|nr:cell wall metabolism sensor histidine kinase WalK [Pseudogracilibacillus sp.]